MDGYGYTPIPPAEASCIIAHLFVELAPPCSCCKREDGVIVIQGTAYDGTGARITIKGEEVRYYGKQRMMNEASDLVADLMEANDLLLTDPQERELRYRAQRSALRNCRKLIHHIELAHEILSGLGDDAFAHWSRMAAGVKNQTAKWYKSDKERAAKMDAQARHQ